MCVVEGDAARAGVTNGVHVMRDLVLSAGTGRRLAAVVLSLGCRENGSWQPGRDTGESGGLGERERSQMAKSTFIRTKPHVNVATALAAATRLQHLGMSLQGARQALNGEPVLNPADRLRLARILEAAVVEQVMLNFARVERNVQPFDP